MNRLSKPIRVQLYLPSQDKDGNLLEGFEGLAHDISCSLASRFGGVTRSAATGYYAPTDKPIAWEAIQVIEFHADDQNWEKEGLHFLRLALQLGQGLRQDAIAYAINGEMILINPPE